jgi:hypothetical protein
MISDPDYQNVLKTVSAWPAELRITLAHDVLGTVQRDVTHKPHPTLDRALGLGRGQQPPPSDEQVKQWIEGYRLGKHAQ